MNDIRFASCRPEPLASYLKALAILRLVGEQKDFDVAGWWDNDQFMLRTNLTEDQIVTFFLEEYRPTPIVAPWNGGSGFYAGDAREGLNAIRSSSAPRFEAYRKVIQQVFQWPEFQAQDPSVGYALRTLESDVGRSSGKKRDDAEGLLQAMRTPWQLLSALPDNPLTLESPYSTVEAFAKGVRGPQSDFLKAFRKVRTYLEKQKRGGSKEQVIARARNELLPESLPWLDSAVVILPDDRAVYNPVLGTGGNEGRLDFSNNFMQRLAELLLQQKSQGDLLRSALFDSPVADLPKSSIGQFDPGKAGGFNQGQGVETKEIRSNPWDFVLMLEGATLLASAAVRRGSVARESWAAIPFTVTSKPAGLASGSEADGARAETWLPLWNRPATLDEIRHMFGEGRSSVGRRRASDGLDFARAVATLGVDRGLSEFTRYAFLERRGKSYVALPAGRARVHLNTQLSLLDELDAILPSVDSMLRNMESVPARWSSARRNIDEAILGLCQNADPMGFLGLLRAIGRLESLVAQAGPAVKDKVRPITGLSTRWLLAAQDLPEVRVAAALASIRPTGKVGSIRANLAGTHPGKSWQWDPSQAQKRWSGATLAQRLAGVLDRRLLDASRLGVPTAPIRGVLPLRSSSVVPFLYGLLDEVMLEELLWAFTWIDWRGPLDEVRESWAGKTPSAPLPRDYALLKLALWPGPVDEVSIKPEPRMMALLLAGRVKEACMAATSRLRVSGLVPRSGDFGELRGVQFDRLAAALLVPIYDVKTLERMVLVNREADK